MAFFFYYELSNKDETLEKAESVTIKKNTIATVVKGHDVNAYVPTQTVGGRELKF